MAGTRCGMNLVAIVTGGSSGVGLATALKLGEMQFAVAIVGRRKDALEEAERLIRSRGGEVMGVAADVSRSAEVERVVQKVMAEWGRVDVLVNNAGYAPLA